MYVKHHEQFEIVCGATLNTIYYYIIITCEFLHNREESRVHQRSASCIHLETDSFSMFIYVSIRHAKC